MSSAPSIDYIVVIIDDVDLPNRLVHAYDKTQVRIQVSFRETPAGILRIPAQGEQWLAIRRGYIWYLQDKLDSADQHQEAVDTMEPGDLRITGKTVTIDGDQVIINDQVQHVTYARAFAMMGG